MRPYFGLSDALGLVELARHGGAMRAPHHQSSANRERGRGKRDVILVDQQSQSNLGGRETRRDRSAVDKEGAQS